MRGARIIAEIGAWKAILAFQASMMSGATCKKRIARSPASLCMAPGGGRGVRSEGGGEHRDEGGSSGFGTVFA